MFDKDTEYRFETIEEMREWQKLHPVRGLYGENRLWLGCCREQMELYHKSHELGVSCEELYDKKYGILRYEI